MAARPGARLTSRPSGPAPSAGEPWLGAKIGDAEVVGYDGDSGSLWPAAGRWSKINLTGARIAIVEVDGRPVLVIFRRRWGGLGADGNQRLADGGRSPMAKLVSPSWRSQG